MTSDHEEIEELLAGYVLRSLEGEDAERCERLLADHVPGCLRCRRTLAEFQAVTGELALAVPGSEPPEVLLRRLSGEIGSAPRAGRRRSFAAWIGVAATVAAVGLGAWSALLEHRVSTAERSRGTLLDAFDTMARPDAKNLSVSRKQERAHLRLIYAPSEGRMYLIGKHLPDPSPGNVFEVWLGRAGRFAEVGSFIPSGGQIVVSFRANPGDYDELVITEEPEGAAEQPTGPPRWTTTL